ncbi:ribonuclease P protein component [Candidatus Kaiserbacteria bacterium]|nr:ribonuclease P protein component [Candidatus Kaiserbacteria bacterium]
MFPRHKRLEKKSFPDALALGKRTSSPHFKVIIPTAAKGYSVVVPKKVARLSVTRHRIKRRTLSILRTIDKLPPALILFPQSSVAQMSYQNIKDEILGLLSKLR